MRKKISSTAWWLGGIMLLALAFRLANFGTEPYWGDEVLSLDIVRHFSTAREMLHYLSEVEFHPPLYYLMMRPWTAAFGTTETATRSLSLIFSMANVALVYVFGKRLFSSKSAGLCAAFVLAILPMQIEFGQEARPYAIFCCFGTVSAMALWEYLRDRRPGWLVLYAASAAIGIYLHYSFFFVLAATAGWWLLDLARGDRKRMWTEFRRFVVTHGAVFLAFYPWLFALLYKLLLGNFTFLGAERHVVAYRPPEAFAYMVEQVIWMTKAKYIYRIEIIVKLIFKVSFLCALVALIRQHARTAKKTDGTGEVVGFLAWLFVVPIVLFIVSPQSVPYSTLYVRHIIFATVPAALFLGWVFASIPKKHAAALIALFVASQITFVANVMGNDEEWDQDFRLKDAGTFIDKNYKPGDLVIASVSIVRTDLSHYLDPQIPVAEVLPIPFYGNDMWYSRSTLGIMENESQVRIDRPSEDEISGKLARLEKIYHPKRVWLYGFSARDFTVNHFYMDRHWRHVFSSLGNIFVLDMYSQK